MEYRVRQISGGEAGTDQTINQISTFVVESLSRRDVRLLAIKILQAAGASSKTPAKAAFALYQWVRSNIKYILDPVGVETVQDPEATLKVRAGDCDDHTVLLASLAMAVGIPARFVVIGPHRDRFEHIYTELQFDGKWTPADTTISLPFGQAGQLAEKKIYNIEGKEVMRNLGFSPAVRALPIERDNLQLAIRRRTTAILKDNWNNGRINVRDLNDYLRVIGEKNWPGAGTLAERPVIQAIKGFRSMIRNTGRASSKSEAQASSLGELDGFLKSIWNGVKSVANTAIGAVAGAGIPIISGAAGAAGSVLFPGGGAPAGDPNEGYKYGHSAGAWASLSETEKNKVRNFQWTGRADVDQWLQAYRTVAPTQGASAGAKYAYEVMVSGGQLPRAASAAFQFSPNIQTQVGPEAAAAGARAGVTELLQNPMVLIGIAGVVLFIVLKK